MDRLVKIIERQIASNQGKNMLLDDLGIFQFTPETLDAMQEIGGLNAGVKQSLVELAVEHALDAFCRVNQYYSFELKAKNSLREIYAGLFVSCQARVGSVEEVSKKHYENLKRWLLGTNPFAEKVYRHGHATVIPVACSEYSPDLQVDILRIDINRLPQPVLDIGCGSGGHLVNYLRNRGVEVYGFDRLKPALPYLIQANWLEYNYGIDQWGTIVSNLGFSNHFNHHHLRHDGNYSAYGKTYMRILDALKTGGCFHYAPDLPFIETYLDRSRFSISSCSINDYDLKTTVVKKIR